MEYECSQSQGHAKQSQLWERDEESCNHHLEEIISNEKVMNKMGVDIQLSPAVLISIQSKLRVFSRPGIPQTVSCRLHIAFACVMVVIGALRALNERGTAVPHPCNINVNCKAHCEANKVYDNI